MVGGFSGAGDADGDLARIYTVHGAVGDGVAAAGGVYYVCADDGEECGGVIVLAGGSARCGAGGVDGCAIHVYRRKVKNAGSVMQVDVFWTYWDICVYGDQCLFLLWAMSLLSAGR